MDLGPYGGKVTEPAEVIPALRRGIRKSKDGTPAVLEFITVHER